jgi:hypothetical protein
MLPDGDVRRMGAGTHSSSGEDPDAGRTRVEQPQGARIRKGSSMHTLRRVATFLLVRATWIALVAALVVALLAVIPDTSNEVIMAPGPWDEPAGRHWL